jgi:hypothetical protein
MPAARAVCLGILLLAAKDAWAASSAAPPLAAGLGPFRWDFEAPGRMRDLAERVIRVAWTFLPLSFIAALAVEAFGRAPGQVRDFAAVVWRGVVVVFLLTFYIPLFNGLMKHVFDPLAEAVTPVSGVAEFLQHAVQAAKGLPSSEAEQVVAEEGIVGAAAAIVEGAGFGGLFYDSLVSFLLLLAEGLVIVMAKLGKLLAALLFCLGPLALAGSVPRPSRTGTRWFGHFVTILSWPIFTGLLLSILVAMGREGAETAGYLAAVIASLLTAAMALATPRLASQVVGGTLENLIAAGYESAKGIERDATSPGVRDIVKTVVGGPGRNAEGGSEWRPGIPQRVVTAVGTAIANGFRPRSGDPAALAGSAFGAARGNGAANAPIPREGAARRPGSRTPPTGQTPGSGGSGAGNQPPVNPPGGGGPGPPPGGSTP